MGSCFSVQISGGDSVFNRCWDCAARRLLYVRHLQDNLESLKNARDQLKALKDDVMQKLANQESPQMKRLNVVQDWISKVEDKLAEVDNLLIDGEEEKMKLCLGSYCSKTCNSSYRFGEMVVKRLNDVISLQAIGKFEAVVERASIEPVIERPTEPTLGLESMLDKVWYCLMEDKVGVIGIYGMGGVGKTTLLTQINNRFLNIPLNFNFVIWVVASKDLRLDKIQDEIAEKIGISSNDSKWKHKSFDEKAIIIFGVLSKKKFLLLLDDVWSRVKLKDIGIPLPSEQNKSKILFTTRSEEVCGQMEAQRSIKVEILAWEVAWSLFQDKVGRETLNADPDIPLIAEDVARECGGLPLALITVGRAMACKRTLQEWKHAIEILRRSASNLQGMADEVLPILKFSYDTLANEKIKSCLLYCALFPEDYEIPKDELIEKWICEAFWDDGGDNQVNDIINEGYNVLATLVHACLLEDKDRWVKMHDVIRDMALWIACSVEKEKENYFVQTGAQLWKPPDLEKWREVRRMSLMQNKIQQLRQVPTSSYLLTLFLGGNNDLKRVNDGFFQSMKALTVLDLSNTGLTAFPTGISELASLQYLNIADTSIQLLPSELTKLKKLKCLNLEGTYSLRGGIPKHVITSFQLLQVLRMNGSGLVVGTAKKRVDVSVEELESLEDLKVLSLTIRDSSVLHHFCNSHKLLSCTQALRLENLDSCVYSASSSSEDTAAGEASHHGNSVGIGLRESLTKRSFDGLHKVKVYRCNYLQDLTWLMLAPKLMQLSVYECEKLEEIISYSKLGEVVVNAEQQQYENLNPFSRLRECELIRLPKLKSIIAWKSLLFPLLDQVVVYRCPVLKKLPLNSNSAKVVIC